MLIKRFLPGIAVLAIMLAACAPAATPAPVMEKKPTDSMPVKPTDSMAKPTDSMAKPTDSMAKPTDSMMDKATPPAMSEPAAWLSASLTDVRTGSTFKLADFKGKVVVVENFAVWCSTCLTQQKEVKKLKDQLGQRMDVVFVNLDIDSNEDAAKVKAYIEKNGFDWSYAVAPAAVAREMAKLFGDQFLNPPSAPMLVLDKMGVGHPLPFGVKSAADLKAAVEKYLQ